MIEMKLHGLRELQNRLLEITDALAAAKALSRAARKAFKPVLEEARRLAPTDTELVVSRIRMQVIRPKSGNAVVVVGLRLSQKPHRNDNPSRHREGPRRKKFKSGAVGVVQREPRNWAWYEKGVPARGIAAQPFFRPALDKNASLVLELFKEHLAKDIQRLAKKAGNR